MLKQSLPTYTLAGVLAVAWLAVAQLLPVHAQSFGVLGRTYVTPFPEEDKYKLYVFGDSLGDGVWSGLYRAFQEDGNVEVVKKSRVSTGFVRTDYYDWNAALDGILRQEKAHIGVVMVGANDMQAIREGNKWYKVGTEEWRRIYGARVDDFIKRMKTSHLAVYWVGLPVMRSDNHNQDMQVMNEIVREKAFLNGVKFIDTWNGFVDQSGRYSAFGPDLSGQVKRLRADDGVHFTMQGYRKLAHFVEREIRRDLRVAKAERNIPLAGSEAEQARAIRRDGDADRPAEPASPALPGQRRGALPDDTQKQPEGQGKADAPAVVVKSDRQAALELPRPAISEAAAIATSGSNYSPEGELIASDLPDGLTALASISPINDPSLASPQRLPLTQRPYYRVLIKGEQLAPKAGRADDFSWPRG
ncbi:MAG: DUF459 domain-containing protein [Pseudomonadota bacterium]|nr:DUF459 domain-containing protein [Pseudomonadota bacterium]